MPTAAAAPFAIAGQDPHGVARPAQRLAFRLGPGALVLDLSDDVAARVIERVYGPMRCDDARSHPQTAVMRRLADGRLHVRFGRRAVSTLPARAPFTEQTAYNAAREIFARFAASIEGSVAFYGAALAVRDAGVMILGPTTIGKTLLALHAAHAGATFLGDETAMLSLRSSELFAMQRRPSLRESALPWLPSSTMAAALERSQNVFQTERGRFWYALDERDLEGITPCERAVKLRAVCIIRERREYPRIRRIDLAAALPLIAQRAYARPSELNQVAALRKALRDVTCLEITLGTPQDSAAGLLREVSACV
jgi:hypothetical protein